MGKLEFDVDELLLLQDVVIGSIDEFLDDVSETSGDNLQIDDLERFADEVYLYKKISTEIRSRSL